MQLRDSILLLLLVASTTLFAQNNNDGGLKDIEVSFLGTYYEQDGNASPVTGGIGTQKLDCWGPSIVVNVPLDSVKSLSAFAGMDYYSSASSDNIDNPFGVQNFVSGASAQDERVYMTIGYTKTNNQKNSSWGLNFGGSSEFDVKSVSLGGSFSKATKDNNKEINLKLNYFADAWRRIYPIELRNGNNQVLNDFLRHSASFSITGSSVINKRTVAAITIDAVFQAGLLSTPFHRVYFEGEDIATLEILPSTRFKLPIGAKLNYYVSDLLKAKLFYRFYWDSWSVTGSTISIELPIKAGNTLRFYPFYRFHTQTAAKYYAGYQQHLASDAFYTSDSDLSSFSSHKYGLGISIEPLNGIFKYKSAGGNKYSYLKSIDLRGGLYERSDGLSASFYSLALNFHFRK